MTTIAQLQERAAKGDQFALRALHVYKTDADLVIADREARQQRILTTEERIEIYREMS